MNVCPAPKAKRYSRSAEQGVLWVSVTHEFSRNLQRLIKKSGLQDQDIAKAVGVTPSRFSNWKRGHHLPRPEQWDILAKILKCHYEDFFLPEGAEPDHFDDLIEELDGLASRFKRRRRARKS